MEQLKIPQKVNKDVVLEQPVDQDHAENDHVEKIVKKPEKKEEEEDDKEHDDEPETEEKEEKRDNKLNPQPILMAPQEPQGDKNMKGKGYVYMMTSSNGNIFRVTGHLCGEFPDPRWIPRTKANDAELWCFLWSASE